MKTLLKPFLVVLFMSPWLLGNSAAGCANAFSEAANKNTKEALLYKARMHIDKSEWTEALAAINSISSADQSSNDVKVMKASAYAGRCGLNLINLANDVASQLAGTKLLKLLLNHMKSVTAYVDCSQAEQIMKSISVSERSSDDQVFLAFVAFSKMGAILASSGADDDGDGAHDQGGSAFNPCNDGAADIVEADVKELGASLFVAYNAIRNSGIGIADSLTSLMGGASGLCSTFDCDKEDASDFDATDEAGLRTLMNANEIGFEICGGPSTDIGCLCPP